MWEQGTTTPRPVASMKTMDTSPQTSRWGKSSPGCSMNSPATPSKRKYKRMLVAPRYLRNGLLKHIADEIKNHEAGKPARIRLKLNSLVDEVIIDALYRASMRVCPSRSGSEESALLSLGQPGLSENHHRERACSVDTSNTPEFSGSRTPANRPSISAVPT
jgi:hypothetical protein